MSDMTHYPKPFVLRHGQKLHPNQRTWLKPGPSRKKENVEIEKCGSVGPATQRVSGAVETFEIPIMHE